MKLPTTNYSINNRTKQIIFVNHCSTASPQKSFHQFASKKWNSLPVKLRNFDNITSTLTNKMKEFYTSEIQSNPNVHAQIQREFRFYSNACISH